MKRIVALAMALLMLCTSVSALAEVVPFDKTVTVTAWSNYNAGTTANAVESWEEQLVWQTIQDKFNIDLQWTHSEAPIALQIASGDMCDVLYGVKPSDAATYGYQGAFRPLNDVIEQYMPNFQRWLEKLPAVKALITAPDGNIYCLPRMLVHPEAQVWAGWYMNVGLLEKEGLKVPNTVDEMLEVLRAYKAAHPESYPITGYNENLWLMFNWFATAYDTNYGQSTFWVVDSEGKVQYAPSTENYRKAVETISQMFAEGLIDPNFDGNDLSAVDERMINGSSIMTFLSHVSGLTKQLNLMDAAGIEPTLAEIPSPLNNVDSDRWNTGTHTNIDAGFSCVISTTASDEAVEAIARYQDWLYDENSGYEVLCHGIEGEHWVKGEDYEPAYGGYLVTEKVTKDPSFVDYATYFNNYIGHISTTPTCYGRGVMLALYTREEGVRALEVAKTDWIDHKYPTTLLHSEADTERIAVIESDLKTYVKETTMNWIYGTTKLDDAAWEAFQQRIGELGIDEYKAIMETSYVRYIENLK